MQKNGGPEPILEANGSRILGVPEGKQERHEMFVIRNTENKLWDNLKKGDQSALGDLYNLHIDSLFEYGISHTQDRNYVMDCIHDLFLDLYKYRKNVAVHDDGKYYLFKCLKRKLNRKYKTREVNLTKDSEFMVTGSLMHHLKSHEDAIIRAERRTEKQEKLSVVLEKLTKKQKTGIFLRFNQEKSYEEISEIMGISIPTARTLIYRALKVLRS